MATQKMLASFHFGFFTLWHLLGREEVFTRQHLNIK
jgi:hypothetical protein